MMSSLTGMLPLVLMFVVLYFVMIRPQMKRQKEHRAMIDALNMAREPLEVAAPLAGTVASLADVPDEVFAAAMVGPGDILPQLVDLCARFLAEPLKPQTLLALLKHPLVRLDLGETSLHDAAEALEEHALRGLAEAVHACGAALGVEA